MPIYEFKCTKCGHRFSLLEPLGESHDAKECPSCGSRETNRLVSTLSALRAYLESGCKPSG